MKSGFWQIQLAEKDKYKTAFTLPFGHYEWNVMPFGLKNAPSCFKRIIDNIIWPPLEKFYVAYIDDIFVFSENTKLHEKHLTLKLVLLNKINFHIKIYECYFFK